MENTNKVNNSQINGMKSKFTLGLLATLCLLTSSFGIKAMENTEIGVNIVNSEESERLSKKLKTILINENSSPEENLKEFKDTLAALEKIAGSSIGKIIDDNLLLHEAAIYGKTESIKVLVELGADINAKAANGEMALHNAAIFGKTEVIRVLVEKGADIEAKTTNGWTALHDATLYGKTEAIKVLVELGADIEAKDVNGRTALHLAAKYGKTEAIKVLVEKGADIKAKDKYGRTASDLAKDIPGDLELLNLAKDYDASEDKKVFMRNLMVDGVEKFVPEILGRRQLSQLSEQQHRFNLVLLRALNTAMQKQDYDLINFILIGDNKLIEAKATLSSFFRQALCIALKETGKKSAFEMFYQSSDKNTINKSTLDNLLKTDTEKFDVNEENTYLKFLKKAAEINKLPIKKGFIGGERTKRCLMNRLNEKSLSEVRIHFIS